MQASEDRDGSRIVSGLTVAIACFSGLIGLIRDTRPHKEQRLQPEQRPGPGVSTTF